MNLEPVTALVAIDVGNTRIGMAVWDDDGLHLSRRVSISEPEEWAESVRGVWEYATQSPRRAIVVSSVQPAAAERLDRVLREETGASPLYVRREVPLPMPLDIEGALEVGVDRICSAAAAYDRVRGACAIASFGTATTIDCVSAQGVFLGGAILPGIEMAYDVLHERTAQLPRVEAGLPAGPFGKNTREAIINGVVYGAVGALREIVERFATALNEWPHLVLTGGNALVVSPLADFADSVAPDLCLAGVALAYRRASGQA